MLRLLSPFSTRSHWSSSAMTCLVTTWTPRCAAIYWSAHRRMRLHNWSDDLACRPEEVRNADVQAQLDQQAAASSATVIGGSGDGWRIDSCRGRGTRARSERFGAWIHVAGRERSLRAAAKPWR